MEVKSKIIFIIVFYFILSFNKFVFSEQIDKIPIIHVKGTHYQVGYQIGTYMKKQLNEIIQGYKKEYNNTDIKWEDIRDKAKLFLEYSQKYMPEYVEEIKGASVASGVDMLDLFVEMCEELLLDNFTIKAGCTDLIASNDFTLNGSVLIAHNNDTLENEEKYAVVIHYQVEGEPEILALSYGGLGISFGFNSAGICLTGNELSMNDMKTGVPRLLLCRKILGSKTLKQAISAAIFQPRASNYNMIITDINGEIYDIEGSGSDQEIIYAKEGYLVHTNHYISDKMHSYEYDSQDIINSILRYNRADRLMKKNKGLITIDMLKEFLKDHINYPDSICSHTDYKTTVSSIIDLTNKTMFLTKGNPCKSIYYKYTLYPGFGR